MDKAISNNLCHGLRAVGIPKKQAHQIQNIVTKWYDNNGSEWTVKRIKDLRQWYETSLSGQPNPPVWFRKTQDNMPIGIWHWVFELPTPKALGVLSLDTVFVEKEPTKAQIEKFEKGLRGSGSQETWLRDMLLDLKKKNYYVFPGLCQGHAPLGPPLLPTIFDMNGSVPIQDGHSTMHPDSKLGKALKALELSWDCLPQATFNFLDNFRPQGQDLLGYMPSHVLGNDYVFELNKQRSPIVGKIGCIQEAELKARWIANPNRVTQVTLEPMKNFLMTLVKRVPWDYTHDQESGMAWVQRHLKQGIELAGSDMTSASDLLDLDMSLSLIEICYGLDLVEDYKDYRDYFKEVSRSEWWCPQLNRTVKWEQGDPLGTGPSFPVLTLTNGAAGVFACFQAASQGDIPEPSNLDDFSNYFAVIGDDFICDAKIEKYYTRIVQSLGGEINLTKTLKSDRVAEFAGRVITPDLVTLKRVNYVDPSDNSFMNIMSQLGDQAKFLLKPKQRETYTFFRNVPGIAIDGPWMKDSYGVPFTDRYQWYLEEVQPALERLEPDLLMQEYDMELLRAKLSLAEASESFDLDKTEPFDEGYLPSQVTPAFKSGGDPRLRKGKTTLEVLHSLIEEGTITPFEEWKSERTPGLAAEADLGDSIEFDFDEDPFDR